MRSTKIETASRRHRPPPCIDDTSNLILNRSILFRLGGFLNLRCHILSNASPNSPKTLSKPLKILPNPSQNLSKSTQDQSKSSLGAHLGPMLEKRSIPNGQKAARKRPRAPKRRPRPSQTLPKWSPRPSQIHFLN